MDKAYLDVCIGICPYCGGPYADASWYIELESDVECGRCGKSWNPKKHKTDRILLEFSLDEDKKVKGIEYSSINR
jgi:hypothetical protein